MGSAGGRYSLEPLLRRFGLRPGLGLGLGLGFGLGLGIGLGLGFGLGLGLGLGLGIQDRAGAVPADLSVRGLLYSLRMNSLRALLPLAPKGTSFALKYTGLFLSSHEFRMPSPVSCDEATRRGGASAGQRVRGPRWQQWWWQWWRQWWQ